VSQVNSCCSDIRPNRIVVLLILGVKFPLYSQHNFGDDEASLPWSCRVKSCVTLSTHILFRGKFQRFGTSFLLIHRTFVLSPHSPSITTSPLKTDLACHLQMTEVGCEGSIDSVSPWKRLPYSAGTIEVERRLLDPWEKIGNPTLASSSLLFQNNLDSMNPSNFASIYLNRG
jgi:hypothetical protein